MALTSSIISEFPQLYRKVTVQLSRRFRLESEVPSTAIPAVVVIFALGLLWTTFTFLSGQKLKSIPILDAGPGNLRQRKDVYTFKARELLRAGYQKVTQALLSTYEHASTDACDSTKTRCMASRPTMVSSSSFLESTLAS